MREVLVEPVDGYAVPVTRSTVAGIVQYLVGDLDRRYETPVIVDRRSPIGIEINGIALGPEEARRLADWITAAVEVYDDGGSN